MAKPRAFVTGSSRGIGAAIARALHADGFEVAVHGAQASDELAAIAKELRARSYTGDLAAPKVPEKLIGQVWADGPLDALVNNAGVYLPLNFLETGEAAFDANFDRTFRLNFEAPLRMSRAVALRFGKEGGKILNVASRVGFRGEPGASLYAASKAALINLTRSLAVELAPKKIGVFGIAPGWVETAMAREGMESRREEIEASIPLGRVASPEDCGAAAAFLLSDRANYLSGVTIDINGASYFH